MVDVDTVQALKFTVQPPVGINSTAGSNCGTDVSTIDVFCNNRSGMDHSKGVMFSTTANAVVGRNMNPVSPISKLENTSRYFSEIIPAWSVSHSRCNRIAFLSSLRGGAPPMDVQNNKGKEGLVPVSTLLLVLGVFLVLSLYFVFGIFIFVNGNFFIDSVE